MTIAPFVEFRTAGSDASYSGANFIIGSYNVGPATNETDSYFQELNAYLRPRYNPHADCDKIQTLQGKHA